MMRRSLGAIDLTTLEEIVAAASSYEDLQEKLADIYQGIDTTRFREVVESAMILADLKGRSLE
jgi:phage gp29-like protein